MTWTQTTAYSWSLTNDAGETAGGCWLGLTGIWFGFAKPSYDDVEFNTLEEAKAWCEVTAALCTR